MTAPIIIQPVNNSNTTIVSSVDWRFDAPKYNFFWNMSANAPNDFVNQVKFPDYSTIPIYSGFSDWKFEVEMDYQSFYIFPSPSTPFCKVEGGLTHSGSLGILSGNSYTKTLNFSFFNLSLLSEGQYFATAKCKVTALNPNTLIQEVISQKDLIIEFRAIHYNYGVFNFDLIYEGMGYYFDANSNYLPNPLIFNYHVSGALPSAQKLYKFHEVGVVPPLVSASDISILYPQTILHPNFAIHMISFSSAISALAVGTYNYNIVIGYAAAGLAPDNFFTLPIILNVLPAVAPTVFSINPSDVNFVATVGGSNSMPQAVSVSSPVAWSLVSAVPTWLTLSQYQGSGNATLLFSLSNYNGLPAGNHSFSLVFSDGFSDVVVNVSLDLKVFLIHPFIPGNLFFTKNTDFLVFTTDITNTYILLNLEITVYKIDTYEEIVYNRVYNVPLPNKNGEFHIGTIVDQLFDEILSLDQVLPSRNSNYNFSNYKPVKVNVTYQEKMYVEYPYIGQILTSGTITNILFIKGNKPFVTNSQMCVLSPQQQNISRITIDSAINISFIHLGTPLIIVKRNNIVIDQHQLISFGNDKIIYSYFRFLNSFSVGDLIEIYVVNGTESRVHRFLVYHSGLDSTFMKFENDNGVMQPFEFIGRVRPSSSYKHVTTSRYNNLYNRNEKLAAENQQSFIVNSGVIEPTDKLILDAIIKSNNVWCSFNGIDGDYFKVDCITTKLPLADSLKTEMTYDLEFNILENSDAILYPKY